MLGKIVIGRILKHFLKYLHERNPFSSDVSLRSISTGVHASTTVNVDIAKYVGNAILSSMEGISAAEYTFKRKNQAVTLDTKCQVRINGATIQIDPQLLFQRLTIAAKATESLQEIFKYELCSHPPALFDSSLLLRQPQKPVLVNAIWKLVEPDISTVPSEVQYVLDGGTLLQRIPWRQGANYYDICTVYTDYVARKYGSATIVFDGYGESSTKDMMHLRWTKGQVGVNVTFTEEMLLTMKKATFLANSINKQWFIDMLSGYLEKKTCKVYHSSGDADLLIVQKAVDSSTITDKVLVGNDTDLLVLLCYHANLESYNILFRPEPKKNTKNPKVWDIKAVKEELGPEICNSVLFLHAILGCNTTSHLYGIGKGASLKKFKSSLHFREKAKVFNANSATHMDIAATGEEVLVSLHNGKQHEQLDALRYKRFCEKVATSVSHV